MQILKPQRICDGFFPKHIFSRDKVPYIVVSREKVWFGEDRMANKETRRFFCMCGEESNEHSHYTSTVTIEMSWEISAETNEGLVKHFKADWKGDE